VERLLACHELEHHRKPNKKNGAFQQKSSPTSPIGAYTTRLKMSGGWHAGRVESAGPVSAVPTIERRPGIPLGASVQRTESTNRGIKSKALSGATAFIRCKLYIMT